MAITEASAPGKVILFGEHAVVYGYPAIAVPVSQVRARAVVADSQDAGIWFDLPNLGRAYGLDGAPHDDPFAAVVRLVQSQASLARLPALRITINSDIPVASGMGSGAATAAALLRALAQHLDLPALARDEAVAAHTFEIERIHHGTPSGIDNTVVTYERPVYFIKGQPQNQVETFHPATPLHLLIADTGISKPTREVVADVRRQWLAEPERFNALFARCGQIAGEARRAIIAGQVARAGNLMNENQAVLRQMTVSAPSLERLIDQALAGGALGAKLSGAGRGGNMVALVVEGQETRLGQRLQGAGARTVFASVVS